MSLREKILGFLSLWVCFNLGFADDHSDHTKKRMRTIQLASAGQDLESFHQEAKKRELPTRFFEELKKSGAWVVVKSTSGGAQYRNGIFSGGTIYISSVDTPLDKWNAVDFSNFYNELFHAWWHNVFLKDEKYKKDREKLLGDPILKKKYDLAFPGDSKRAQEEAYSETVALLITLTAAKRFLDPVTGKIVNKADPSKLAYKKFYTVAPVSHSDVPGYTPAAEETYPDEEEYRWLFQKLFNQEAPKTSEVKKN